MTYTPARPCHRFVVETPATEAHPVGNPRYYAVLGAAPFLLLHVLPLLALYTGTNVRDWILCVVLYLLRMFGVTAGYHRYFSHRTFKTSRVMQFLLAVLAQTSAQKGVLWWAAHHRDHHKHSDQDGDPHDSRRGIWFSHVGWILSKQSEATDYAKVKDLAKYPELVWLNRHWLVVPVVFGAGIALAFGWSGLLIGYFFSTALLWHGTFTINSLSHMFGSRRYDTGDRSRNNWLLAMVTLGEGWHNNHHHYQSSCRQGFAWWEVDVTYYVLYAMSRLGLVWDLRAPPHGILSRATRLQGPSEPASTLPPAGPWVPPSAQGRA